MFRQLKKFTLKIIAGANAASIAVMLLVGNADRVDPAAHPAIANITLAFPALLAVNAAFLVFWLMAKPRWAALPVGGFILCYGPVRTYCPLNITKPVPKGAIKVLSYNIWSLSSWKDSTQNCEIADYLLRQDADIVCLEEAGLDKWKRTRFDKIMAAKYGYRDSSKVEGIVDEIDIFSKFPIVGKEKVKYPSRTNNSAAFHLLIGGDTVTVVANHFESNGFSPTQKERFKQMVKGGLEVDSAKVESKALFARLVEVAARRAPQADSVAAYIAARPGRSFIVCGDFNDTPISYVRRTVAKGLTDCYVETGNGPGISYHSNAFFVRIDNILCSKDWQPYGCKVDNTIGASDHYPIYCWLKKKPKQSAGKKQ